MRFAVERMQEGDLDEVLSLEQKAFPDPWTLGMFKEELSRRPPSLSLVARDSGDGRLLGYLNSIAIYDELHVGNIAVENEVRGKGIGKALLRRALDDAREHFLVLATLEVRATNRAAIALYERFGFHTVAIRKRYYGEEDALVMVLDLAPKPLSEARKD
jgi:ribosomal-protein-alanine N-acetyltransferase